MTRARVAHANRPEFPSAVEKIGEDPARFLATDLDETPRIQGIQSEDVLDEWERVEHELPDGPRKQILTQLEARRQQLHAAEDGQSATLSEDAQALVSDVQSMDDPADVQAALDGEVARDGARKEVVAACNVRLDELADEEPEPAREIPQVEYDSREDPEYETAFNDALSIAKAFGLQQVGERLEQERGRDAPRPHVIDALETRQDALRAELPDADSKEEVVA